MSGEGGRGEALAVLAVWRIPSAFYPGLKPVTLATLAVAGLAGWLLARERAILRG